MEIDAENYWLSQITTKADSTKTSYIFLFKKFCQWAQMTPNQLIDTAKTAKKNSEDPRETMVLETKVKQYLAYLKMRGQRDHSLGGALTAIKSFFDANCFPLKMSRRDLTIGDAQGSRIPEKEEIRRMLMVAQHHRATILVLKDTGLRISDVVNLTWSGMKDYGGGFRGWTIKTRKRGIMAHCFIGPEASEALDLLKRGKNDRLFPLKPKCLSNRITKIIREANLSAGLSAHGLRKYFNTELQAARVDQQIRYQLMGKATSAYDEKRETHLLEIYRGAYDHLRVGGVSEAALGDFKRSLEALRSENRVLRDEVETLRTQNREGESQKTENEELKKRLSRLEEKLERIYRSQWTWEPPDK